MAPKASDVILGISCFHGDSSAALIVGDQLVAAVEEERFSRLKHTAAFPAGAIAYCLAHAGLTPKDVGIVALPGVVTAHLGRKLLHSLGTPRALLRRLVSRSGGLAALGTELEKAGLGGARVERVEHHLAHMHSVRPLAGTAPMTLVTIDGMGDFVSAAYGAASEGDIEIAGRVFYPDSLGYFYTSLSQHLGFLGFGDEFKVMGLSSFGTPRYLEALRQAVRVGPGFALTLDPKVFPIRSRGIRLEIVNDRPTLAPFYDVEVLTRLIGLPARAPGAPLEDAHRDLAASLQARFEEVADHLVLEARRRVGHPILGLAGGCAHNSVWVGKLKSRHAFEQLLVAPASHDAGLSVGAAVAAARGPVRCQERHWALLGPSHGSEAPESAQFARNVWTDDAALQGWIAAELAAGKIVGLMHGRMEFGPRALGSRSILCDPRGADMRDRLNARVKHRESFRPFAAAVLWEEQAAWFDDGFFSPAMEAVFPVKAAHKDRIPAVVHADGSCRIQSVEREAQPFLHGVVAAFHALTGVPMVVNTSFNDNEPIVCAPKEALDCFARTAMDHVIIGSTVYSRRAAAVPAAG